MQKSKRVLVCPLDWGLGHATRCIPIIRSLLAEGGEVIIAADKGPLALLKEEFPGLTFITLRGYDIRYSYRRPMAVSMLMQSPKILYSIRREHRELKKIIKEYDIGAVISDNRYGLWSSSVYTVFITHQINIKCPPRLRFLEGLLRRINSFFIGKYNECWVPDYAGENNLSGHLSHDHLLSLPVKYIGPLSRFRTENSQPQLKYDVLVIASGPDPHRMRFFLAALGHLLRTEKKALIVSGQPWLKDDRMPKKNIRYVSHLNADEMKAAILESSLVICRAGYSSIMDLVALRKNAILIPTPGQTEQEYLAAYLSGKKIFYATDERNFNLEESIKKSNAYGNFSELPEPTYEDAVKELLQRIKAS